MTRDERGEEFIELRSRGENPAGVGQAFVKCGEQALQLGFVAVIEVLTHLRAWRNPHREKMAAHHDGSRNLCFDIQLPGFLEQPLAGGKVIERFRRPSGMIGARHPHEVIDAAYLSGESANRTV